jgi:hypothetical protein
MVNWPPNGAGFKPRPLGMDSLRVIWSQREKLVTTRLNVALLFYIADVISILYQNKF